MAKNEDMNVFDKMTKEQNIVNRLKKAVTAADTRMVLALATDDPDKHDSELKELIREVTRFLVKVL